VSEAGLHQKPRLLTTEFALDDCYVTGLFKAAAVPSIRASR
jgi:hypothetical protein